MTARRFSEASHPDCHSDGFPFLGADILDPHAVTARATDAVAPAYGHTVSGYGSKIPTRHRVRLANGRWRRVYVAAYGNSGSAYVIVDGAPLWARSDGDVTADA